MARNDDDKCRYSNGIDRVPPEKNMVEKAEKEYHAIWSDNDPLIAYTLLEGNEYPQKLYIGEATYVLDTIRRKPVSKNR